MEWILGRRGWGSDMWFVKENNKENVACAPTSSSGVCSSGNWTENLHKWSWSEHPRLFFFLFFFEFHFLTFSCSCLPLGQNTSRRGIVFDCGGPKTQTTDRSVFWIKTQRIRFKVMEWRMEVGRALRVGSRKELWKIVARGRPTRWHLRSANHCLYFLRSKVASSLSLFGVRLPKLELGCFHLE